MTRKRRQNDTTHRRESASEETLKEVDHTHPETDESFGETVTYRRGPAPVHTEETESEGDAPGERDEETDAPEDVSRRAGRRGRSASDRDRE